MIIYISNVCHDRTFHLMALEVRQHACHVGVTDSSYKP